MFTRLGVCLLALMATAGTTLGDDFRLETHIYVGDEEQFSSRSIAYLHDGVYYDVQGIDQPTTIYSPPSKERPGRFILLDPERQVRTEFAVEQLDALLEKITRWAMAQSDKQLQFTAMPKFTTTFADETGVLTLTGEAMTYQLDTEPLDTPERVAALVEFFDAFAKFNGMMSGRPPSPRLAVNRELVTHKRAPTAIRYAVSDIENPDLRSEHKLAWRLSKDDLGAIAVAQEQLVKFREVGNEEYMNASAN